MEYTHVGRLGLVVSRLCLGTMNFGPHTPEEQEIMRMHPELGRRIFAERESPVLQAAAIVAAEHHERWDGHGYPRGLKGEDIHVFGRITALADVFDALTTPRSYKEAWPLKRTLEYLRAESGRESRTVLARLRGFLSDYAYGPFAYLAAQR